MQPVVRTDLQRTSQLLQRTSAELAESRRIDPRLLLASAKERLAKNRAFVDERCIRPEQRPIPDRPATRCASRQECEQDGAAICFTQYLGEHGCRRASSEFEVPGLLSSPSCAAAAAKIAGDKYDLDEAVLDVIMGMIDDVGENLRQSDSLGDNILGFFIGLGSEAAQLSQAYSCKNSFVQEHYGPLESWRSNAQNITSEPERLLASCQADRDGLAPLELALTSSSTPANTDRLEATVANLRKRQSALEAERLPIQFCKGS